MKKPIPQTPEIKAQTAPQDIKVTNENAAIIAVHFLQLIYGRLGYIIKILEKPQDK